MALYNANVKATITAMIALSLLAVAVFGFRNIGCSGGDCGHSAIHRLCIASNIQSASCPNDGNILTLANFHLNALKIFSFATLNAALAVSVLMIIAAALAVPAAVRQFARAPAGTDRRTSTFAQNEYLVKVSLPTVQARMWQWLARSEKRDPDAP